MFIWSGRSYKIENCVFYYFVVVRYIFLKEKSIHIQGIKRLLFADLAHDLASSG